MCLRGGLDLRMHTFGMLKHLLDVFTSLKALVRPGSWGEGGEIQIDVPRPEIPVVRTDPIL